MSLLWLVLGAPLAHAGGEPAPRPDFTDGITREKAQLDVLQGLVDAGMTDQALEVAREIRSQGIKDDRLDILSARAMHQKGMNSEALGMVEAVLQRHPRNAEALAELGLLHADLKHLDEAIAAFEKATRWAPSDPGSFNNLGFVLYAKGEYARAVTAYRAAIQLDPSDVRTRNNLGFALARLEKDSEALEAFRASGDESDARYNLGVACELRADSACALTNYQAALAARNDNVRAQNALNALLSGESR